MAADRLAFDGLDLTSLPARALADLRGRRMAMIFQDPMTALNPVHTIGDQLVEVFDRHRLGSRAEGRDRAVRLLERTGVRPAAERMGQYPHQLSGGLRQRVMIAMALMGDPELLIADEPTTALDVTIQAQILELMSEMKDTFGMAIMLITHAMGVVAENAQRVVVMYAGKVVEEASVDELFGNPRHPYTQGLIRSIPRVDIAGHTRSGQRQRLEQIPGTVPNLLNPPAGCRFAARCKFATDACTAAEPPLRLVAPDHKVACIL
jgi:peptide/nickel transport system ATP-binding protein